MTDDALQEGESAQIPVSEPIGEPIPEPILTPETAPDILSESLPASSAETITEVESTPPEPVPVSESVPEKRVAPPPAHTSETSRILLRGAREKIQEVKKKNLEKIVHYIEANGSIGNDEIQALLKCADATATRYALILVKEGKVLKTGKGPALRYVKV